MDSPVPFLEMTLCPACQYSAPHANTLPHPEDLSVDKERGEEKREVEGLAKTTDPQSGERSNIKDLSQDLRFQRTVCSELGPLNIWDFSGFCSFSILTTCLNNLFFFS